MLCRGQKAANKETWKTDQHFLVANKNRRILSRQSPSSTIQKKSMYRTSQECTSAYIMKKTDPETQEFEHVP